MTDRAKVLFDIQNDLALIQRETSSQADTVDPKIRVDRIARRFGSERVGEVSA